MRPWIRLPTRALAALCLASLLLAAGCASAPQGTAWRQVRTAHFHLHTDLEEAAALDMARALEEARSSVLTFAWRGAADPRGRTEVVVFAREDRFRDFVPNEQIEGLALSEIGEERLLVFFWDDERPSGLPRVAVHEIAHDVSRWFTPLQPPWYSEGTASFLEGLVFDRATQHAILGEIPESMVRVLRRYGRTAASIEGLFDASSAVHDSASETSHFYFTSWLLVHYLVAHQDEPFNQFIRDLSELKDWRAAWSARFPRLGPAELDARLAEYLDGGSFNRLSAAVDVPPFTPAQRVLSPAEAHGLSSWVAHRLGARELSRTERELALALEPQELNASRARYSSVSHRKTAERLALARELVRAHPESGEAWLLLARAGDSPTERRAALDEARRRIPDHPGVLELVAARALDAGEAPAALQQTHVLLRRTTLGLPTALLHLKALAGSGHCDEARHLATVIGATYSKQCAIRLNGKRSSCATYLEESVRQRCEVTPQQQPAAGQVL